MIYEFKQDYNIIEASKNICSMKCEAAVDNSSVTRWFEKFCTGYKNLNNQERLDTSKTVALSWLVGCLGFMAYQPL